MTAKLNPYRWIVGKWKKPKGDEMVKAEVSTISSILHFEYDKFRDVMTIEDIRFGGDFYRSFVKSLPLNTPFILASRNDGILVIKRINVGSQVQN